MLLTTVAKSANAANIAARRDEPPYRRAMIYLGRAMRARRGIDAMLRDRASAREVAAALVPSGRSLFTDPVWGAFARAMSAAYTTSAEAGGERGLREARLSGRMRFVVMKAKRPSLAVPPNPYSSKWIVEHGGGLIREISAQQRELVRGVVSQGYEAGRRPEDIARALRGVVGLTNYQAAAVERRRDLMLEEGADVDTAARGAERYSEQLLDFRADMIARTENKAAQERGRADSWRVARDEELLPARTKRVWQSMPEGPRLSDICRQLDQQETSLDEPFYSEVLEEDVDSPPAHPFCRSTVTLAF